MPDDELRRLHEADPIDPATVPSAHDVAARALREGIVMGQIQPSRTRARLPMVTAAAAVLLLVAGGVVLAVRANQPQPEGPPLPDGGSAMCVETYSLDTLQNREMAFDGTVTSVADDEVTFEVNEWFHGGSSSTITLRGASTFGGITSAGPSVPMDQGTRLLVAGDGGFAWSCGFTQPYDEALAEQWRAALG